jgi:acyl transferase domain-containing protein
MSEQDIDQTQDAVAIIGMAGRFPGAPDVATFWENLKAGRESITFFEDHELEAPPPVGERAEGARFIRARGMLDGIDQFDPKFWGYTPKEAALIDPQQRFFLECAADALDDGGVDPDRSPYSIGVYAGCYMPSYLLSTVLAQPDALGEFVSAIQVGSLQTELGNDKDYIATRAAYKLNLKGPAINVQTACSTSLVAIAMAWQSIMTYQCDLALAGGVTITVPQKRGYYYTEGGMLSADGHCRTFDAKAAGTIFSNACAVVLLKRLSAAIADGDLIHAVIRGAALNNDGANKLSFTAPSVQGQAQVIAMAQALAGVDARTIGYIEAHGTATPLGDPIEVAGLTEAFRQTTADRQFCALGSLKANIGHLDCASGAVGVIKTALMLRDGLLVPSINYSAPNPNIDFAATPFYVNSALKAWPEADWPRRAGVSSFGVGGTNAHVVMEAPPETNRPVATSHAMQVFPVSAKSKDALATSVQALATHLRSESGKAAVQTDGIAAVANTLQQGRRVWSHRAAFAAADLDGLLKGLDAFKVRRPDWVNTVLEDPPLVFMFPGQGAQYPQMANQLYESLPVFREAFDDCALRLKSRTGIDLIEAVFVNTDPDVLKRTEFAQPAIFTVEYAAAKQWLALGIKPSALIGHSVGEYCAAVVAGVMSLDDALWLVARRGAHMQQMQPGNMVSVRASLEVVQPWINGEVCLAAENAPELQVLAGPAAAMEQVLAELAAKEIPCSKLHTSHAFHSAMMEGAVAPVLEDFSGVHLSAPSIPVYSTVTGALLTAAEATDRRYWARNLRDTVRFAPAVKRVLQDGYQVLIEVGPGRTLATLAAQCTDDKAVHTLSSLSPAVSDSGDLLSFHRAAGLLWQIGVAIDWTRFGSAGAGKTRLPGYPYERRRCWLERETATKNNDTVTKASDQTGAAAGSSALLAQAARPQLAVMESLIRQQLAVVAQQLELMRKQG